jgi:hypothetical protein
MFIRRQQVKDSKSGRVFDMAVVLVNDAGRKVERMVPYERFEFLNRSIRHQAPAMWPLEEIKRATDSTDPVAFMISELAFTESRMYEKQKIPPLWKDLVPVSYEAPPWAETVEYQTFERTGRGKRLAANASDLPKVGVRYGRKQIQVEGGGLQYGYSVQELIASQQTKRALPDVLMSAAVDGANLHLNEVALFGEDNFYGLSTVPQDLVVPKPAATGAWDDTNTSPMDILADVNEGITTIYKQTGTNDFPDTVAMPIDALQALGTRLVCGDIGGGVVLPTNMTILAFLKANNLASLQKKIDVNFVGVPGLETAGVLTGAGSYSGKSRVIFYKKDPDRCVMHVPQPLTFLAPQLRLLEVVIPGHYRYAGFELRYPASLVYRDKVLSADA